MRDTVVVQRGQGITFADWGELSAPREDHNDR
jgi:hypothetical protein